MDETQERIALPSIWELAIEDINAERIEQLVALHPAENIRLDFKRELKLTNQKDRLDVSKDVCAFSNASGGLLIYGVEERFVEGQSRFAAGTTPLADNLRDRLLDTLDGLIDPHPPVRVQAVAVGESGWYLVVKVEPSYYELHAVDGQFYTRTDKGNHRMSATEVRRRHEELFQLKATSEQRARSIVAEEQIGVSSSWLGVVVIPLAFRSRVAIETLSYEHFMAPDLPKRLYQEGYHNFQASPRGFEATLRNDEPPLGWLARLRRDGAFHLGSSLFQNDERLFDTYVGRHCLAAIRTARYAWNRIGIRGPAMVIASVRTTRELGLPNSDTPETWGKKVPVLSESISHHYDGGLDDGAAVTAAVLNHVAQCCGITRSRLVDQNGALLDECRWLYPER